MRQVPYSQQKPLLVGKYFHGFVDDRLNWQGQILGYVQDGYFLVQTYDWIIGDPDTQYLVNITGMADWVFYDSASEMEDEYERKYARKGKPDA